MSLPTELRSTARVAVVQLCARRDERAQQDRAAELVTAAVSTEQADIVVLPEGLGPSPPPPLARLGPGRGDTLGLLRRLARCHDVWVAGGFVCRVGGSAAHLYVVAEPDGALHVHAKDAPDPWESSLIRGRPDDGFASTPLGAIGLVHGGEWLRSATAFRLAGQVRLILGGTLGCGRPVAAATGRATRCAPERLAQLVGAPAAHAAVVPPVARSSTTFAATQLVDAQGTVLERLAPWEGDGFACATVALARADLSVPRPAPTDWVVPVPAAVRAAWLGRRLAGRLTPRRQWTAQHESPPLLPYEPPALPPEARRERQIIADPCGTQPLPIPSRSAVLAAPAVDGAA